ncbi:rna polymerase ecf-type sigma factor : RNA polymerase sigma factor, sigma-70 family OS=Singulisphaera acidiphila (strain ATCC BAA-1392 / DSM 18658 / VKM B-2454 / MOB10) GN=Sinac_3813 PE=4 SV=1: Sigma70_r2 [Gemmata massiliana]|uniref:RNA polymerase sigma-70 region 2 domain-containing protein n=1 Tax=Gemmata massiliana TaxID=1210884 RepID=A0A6P2CTH1_9BACT|nr:sigma-70 family RNA polymerase sigma factor [Gemmata massiliana]VTR90994.1 rna polymerase ecf-type sigma factor : RNA polymerase sigma factor, sigma-70 family OS=Singulisphaera acidiphila (strain ATCC BAA-1392 / DSM 18658 / VKM B-2454 / MOB10) GN=Sinac_3813 PE=4 SV=1: Sigma70_r2 [Gemmata massiliana]
MTTESDRLLINRVRKNDQTAWAELDKRYRGRLTAYVRRRLKDHASVEDVVQETFIGFSNSLVNYDDKRDLQTWLFTIAAHKVTDQLRKMGRLRYQSGTDTEDEAMGQAPDDRQRGASTLARSAEQREREEDALGQALRDLVRDFQLKGEWAKVMALELLYVKGWGNAEVAARLKRTEQDIANLKFQAKKRLHDHLVTAKLSPAVFPELQAE